MAQAATVANKATVTSKHLKNSDLVVKLDGLGKEYIRRSDARQLLEDVTKLVLVDVFLENPAAFPEQLLDRLIADQFERVRLTDAKVDEEKWKATYNGDDLRPDTVTSLLKKVFTYDERTSHYILNTKLDTQAQASIMNIFGGSGALKASYSRDEFAKFLQQRNLEVDIKGDMRVVKAVEVYRVNTTTLKQEYSTVISYTEVKPPSVGRSMDSVNLGVLAKDSALVLGQTRAEMARKEMESWLSSAASAKKQDEGEKRPFTLKGKALLSEGQKAFRSAQTTARIASEAFDRTEYPDAAAKFAEARKQYQTATQNFEEALREIEDEKIVNVYVKVKTGNEDKECGAFCVYIYQDGMKEDVKLDFGAGENWRDYSEKPEAAQRNTPCSIPVRGGNFKLIASLEERPGEKNIDWKVDDITVELSTNYQRVFRFGKTNHFFSTSAKGKTTDPVELDRR